MNKTCITFSDTEKSVISRMRQEMDLARANLANAALQAHLAEKARESAADQLVQINKRLEEHIGEMAKQHGVDLTSEKSGRWSFDLDRLELRRLDAPPTPTPVKLASKMGSPSKKKK